MSHREFDDSDIVKIRELGKLTQPIKYDWIRTQILERLQTSVQSGQEEHMTLLVGTEEEANDLINMAKKDGFCPGCGKLLGSHNGLRMAELLFELPNFDVSPYRPSRVSLRLIPILAHSANKAELLKFVQISFSMLRHRRRSNKILLNLER